jgi:hypothetical protein
LKTSKRVEKLAEQIKKMPGSSQLLIRLAAAETDEQREKVFDEVREFIASQENPKDRAGLQENIRTYTGDLQIAKSRLKELEKDLKEKMENTNASIKVGELEDKLAAAREELRQELRRNPEINDLMEEIGAQREVVRGTQFSLSNYLVAWHAQTGERQVEMDEEGHARDIILTARLGNDEKNYQTSLLSPAEDSPEQLAIDSEGIHAGKVTISAKEKNK